MWGPLQCPGHTVGTGSGRYDLTLFPEGRVSWEMVVGWPELVTSSPPGTRGGEKAGNIHTLALSLTLLGYEGS